MYPKGGAESRVGSDETEMVLTKLKYLPPANIIKGLLTLIYLLGLFDVRELIGLFRPAQSRTHSPTPIFVHIAFKSENNSPEKSFRLRLFKW